MQKLSVKIAKIEKKLYKTMRKDRFFMQKGLWAIKKNINRGDLTQSDELNILDKVEKLEKSIHLSVTKRQWRKNNQPELIYKTELPVTLRKDEIVETIKNNQVVILSGETGSGKTTQLPKFCIAAGRGREGMIACTQPRRIAAITVANRIAEEMNEEPGQSVGYKIRFRDKTAENTYIKVMTDGILLAEAQNDRYLNEYDTIIVDEAHERSLNIDFILGILRTLIKKRKDLKIIITSATIDTEKFSKAFDDAPVIEVSGRTFPVDVYYRPLPPQDEELTFVDMAVRSVEEIQTRGPYGDVLIFMPTEADIRETCELLEGRRHLNATVLPLYARLSAGEQKAIFSSVAGRKIVVATNVAETSITIPGIKYVVDTGMARIPQYTPRTRTTSLPVMSVSKSSADQRMGRCGRVENGICFRLYDEDDYNSRPLFTAPEILRANLAEVILRMISLRLGEVESFPFIDPPAAKSIRDGFDTLLELGAITAVKGKKNAKKSPGNQYQLTEKGRVMARLPVDPKLSRMLIEAEKLGCLDDLTVIISALSIRDPRERPSDKTQQADQMHAVFKDPFSDFVSLLNIWKAVNEELAGSKSLNKARKFCKKYFLSFMRLREWRDIHYQLATTLKESGMRNKVVSLPEKKIGKEEFGHRYSSIHKAILAGYLSGIAVKKEKNLYTATRGRETMIFPGSGLFNKAGQWIVAAEIVETSRLYARNVANIDSLWLEEIGRYSCKYTHSNPHWEKKKGAVVASEQVSLFGLVIIPERKVLFGRIDPVEASKIFIRDALVSGDVNLSFAKKEMGFLEHNLKLINNVRQVEDRVRRRDILISEEDLFAFYHSRLEGIYDGRTLAQHIKEKGGNDFLKMSQEDLYNYAPDSEELELFPEKLKIGEKSFNCSYRFKPGNEKDGITVRIPSGIASAVSPESLDWLVPGLVREKIELLIKNLPKEYRKKLVPVANTVNIIEHEMAGIQKTSGNSVLPEKSLPSALGNFIYERFGVNIPASVWDENSIPEHLKMRVSITGGNGKIIASGRDRSVLAGDYSQNMDNDQFRVAKERWEKEDLDKWDCGDIPEFITIKNSNQEDWLAFPGLMVTDGRVSLRLFKVKQRADHSHKEGIRALYEKHLAGHLKSLKKDLTLSAQMKNYAAYFGGEKVLHLNMYKRVVEDLFSVDVRTENDFTIHAATAKPLIYQTGQKLLKITEAVLIAFHQARTFIYNQEIRSSHVSQLSEELRSELERLVPESFLELYEYDRLVHLERFIKGVKIRAERGFVNPDKDRIKASDVKLFTDILNDFLKVLNPDMSDEKRRKIEEFFWLIEEYKVSVFAQELKTPVRISKKRLEKLAGEIKRMN